MFARSSVWLSYLDHICSEGWGLCFGTWLLYLRLPISIPIQIYYRLCTTNLIQVKEVSSAFKLYFKLLKAIFIATNRLVSCWLECNLSYYIQENNNEWIVILCSRQLCTTFFIWMTSTDFKFHISFQSYEIFKFRIVVLYLWNIFIYVGCT